MFKRNRQRIAVSKAQVAKQSYLWGSIAQGFRAFREGLPREDNPHRHEGINQYNAWNQGWDMAQEQQQEKEND